MIIQAHALRLLLHHNVHMDIFPDRLVHSDPGEIRLVMVLRHQKMQFDTFSDLPLYDGLQFSFRLGVIGVVPSQRV